MKEPHKLSAIDIQVRHSRAMLDYRNQNRIVSSDDFIEAWNRADVTQRKYILRVLRNPRPYEAKMWVASLLSKGWERYTIHMLRKIASGRKIDRYSRLSKTQLIKALEKQDDSKDV